MALGNQGFNPIMEVISLGNPKVVFRDLRDTPFKIAVGGMILYFSKQIALNRFKNGYEDHRKNIRNKFQSLYLINVDLEEYADIIYYNWAERNGFRIIRGGDEITCLNDIILDGRIRTKKSLKEGSKTSMRN